MEGMRNYPDKHFDLAICDPAYGRNEDGGRNRSHSVKQKNGSKIYVPDAGYEKGNWDATPVSKEYLDEIFRVSKHQIIFGVNYFTGFHNFGPGRIIWDKVNDGSSQSDAEIAYNSLTDRVDIFRFMWRGMMQGKSISDGSVQQGNKKLNEVRIHPTQKPINLYLWILKKYAKPDWCLLDPGVGSGSSRIAAYELGMDFVGFENNQSIFEKQEERFLTYSSQSSLFLEQPCQTEGET